MDRPTRPADLEHFQLLQSFYIHHCPKAFDETLFISIDPEVVDFKDVVAIVCKVLSFAFS